LGTYFEDELIGDTKCFAMQDSASTPTGVGVDEIDELGHGKFVVWRGVEACFQAVEFVHFVTDGSDKAFIALKQ